MTSYARRAGAIVTALVVLCFVSTGVAASEINFQAQSDERVEFQGWQFATDVVQDNVQLYNTRFGGNVVYSTIAGDYSAIMENKLIARAPVDILYGHVYDAVRYYEGGWLKPANELPDWEGIRADLYPHVLEAWTYDGQVLGLSYFTSVIGMPVSNLKVLGEAGFSEDDYPTTWDEFYEHLYELRDRGVTYPYLPAWYNEQWGIAWSFIAEVLNRGGCVVDPVTYEPRLTADGPGGATLRDWQALWNDGLVPKEILGYMEADHIEAWESGRFAYASYMAYNIRRSNNPSFSNVAGHTGFVPYRGQPWGILDNALYIMTNRPRSQAHEHDVMAFLTWYGFRDDRGEPFVAQRWLRDFMLFSGYKSVMESPDARAVMADSLVDPSDVDELLEVYKHADFPKGEFMVVWSAEFQGFLRETLQDFLQNERGIGETVDRINGKVAELNAMYGI